LLISTGAVLQCSSFMQLPFPASYEYLGDYTMQAYLLSQLRNRMLVSQTSPRSKN